MNQETNQNDLSTFGVERETQPEEHVAHTEEGVDQPVAEAEPSVEAPSVNGEESMALSSFGFGPDGKPLQNLETKTAPVEPMPSDDSQLRAIFDALVAVEKALPTQGKKQNDDLEKAVDKYQLALEKVPPLLNELNLQLKGAYKNPTVKLTKFKGMVGAAKEALSSGYPALVEQRSSEGLSWTGGSDSADASLGNKPDAA